MDIQLSTYSYYDSKTKKRKSLKFYLQGKEIDHEKYLECVDQFNMEYTQKTGEDNNGILRAKEIGKMQSTHPQPQSCPTNCPDCGEPYESEQPEENYQECHCADCESTRVIEDCLNFVFGTDASIEQKAQTVVNLMMVMREIGYQECEVEIEAEEAEQNQSGSDIYNININVESSKNISKTVGNIVDELKKSKSKKSTKQNLNISEES